MELASGREALGKRKNNQINQVRARTESNRTGLTGRTCSPQRCQERTFEMRPARMR